MLEKPDAMTVSFVSEEKIAELEKRAEEGCLVARVALGDIARGGTGVSNVACFCNYCSVTC